MSRALLTLSARLLAASVATGVVGAGCNLDLAPYKDPVDASLRPATTTGPGEGGSVPASDAGASDAGDGSGDSGTTPPIAGKRIFVTSTLTTGDFGGQAGADAICQRQATAARLGGTFLAWVSVKAAGAASRIKSAGPWYLVDKTTLVFPSADKMSGAAPLAAINLDETGKKIATARDLVWTGTAAGGTVSDNCSDFTLLAGVGLIGLSDEKTTKWTQDDLSDCSVELHLYCFEP